jgi:hypothetical protein
VAEAGIPLRLSPDRILSRTVKFLGHPRADKSITHHDPNNRGK